MQGRYIFAIALLSLLPYSIGKCSITWRKKVIKTVCTDINQDEYLTDLFKNRTNLTDIIEDKNITKVSINIANSYFPIVDDWIYLPWEDLNVSVNTLKMVNCSVNSIRSLYKFPSLETLDLSGNNITDFTFLVELKKLRVLHLRHSTIAQESLLFIYRLRNQKAIDFSHSNLNEFTLVKHIERYDLSENRNLKSIAFNQSVPVQYLNLSGSTQLQSFKNYGNGNFLCISSLHLSHFNHNFNLSLLMNNIKIADEIVLSHNNIQILNEVLWSFTDLISYRCPGRFGISVDLSHVNLKLISSSYFSDLILGYVNLSNNNLSKLEGSIFSHSVIVVLDISNSNVSMIEASVFNLTTLLVLNLSRNNITSLEGVFDNIKTIKGLDLSFNPIEILTENTFNNCKDLEVLNLTSTFVGSVGENSFLNLPSLRQLNVSFVGAMNVSAIKNMYVTDLTICNSLLDSLEPEHFKGFHKLNRLTFLNSSVSNFSSLSFKGLNMLKILNIKELSKPGKDISFFKHLPHLQDLNLSNHKIKSIGGVLEGLVSLKNLNLSSNEISELVVSSFASLKKLEVLSLAHNQLTSIAVGTFLHLQKLTHLYLHHNTLQKLLPGVFSSLQRLSVLDISHNQLLRTKPHILLSNTLTNLKSLYLENNGLGNEYVANDNNVRRYEFGLIASHASLEHVDINFNEWSCSTLIDVLASFTTKNITYKPKNPVYTEANINGITCLP